MGWSLRAWNSHGENSLHFELEDHFCECSSPLKHVCLGRKSDPWITYAFGRFLIPYDRIEPYSWEYGSHSLPSRPLVPAYIQASCSARVCVTKHLYRPGDSGLWSSLKDALIPSKTLMPLSAKTQRPWGSEHSCLHGDGLTKDTEALQGVQLQLLGLLSPQKSVQLCIDPRIFPPVSFPPSPRSSCFLHSWWGCLDTGIAQRCWVPFREEFSQEDNRC